MSNISILGSGSGGSGITINVTTITGGTDKHVLYDNAGTVGEAANFTINSGNPDVPNYLSGGQYQINELPMLYADPTNFANYFLFGAGNTNVQSGGNNYGIGSSQSQGNAALGALAGGSNNLAWGTGAGKAITNAGNNVIVGHFAGANLNNSSNVAIGHLALNADSLSSGQHVAIGDSAMAVFSASGQSNNVAIGTSAMAAATGGSNNVAIGQNALGGANTGNGNFALGSDALSSNTSGQFSVAIGNNTLPNSTGGNQTAIGRSAGVNVTAGDTNTLIGYQVGGGITTGRANTVIGGNVGSLAAGLSNAIIFADGDGNIRLDYNNTGVNKWVLQTGLDLAYVSTAGVLVADASGNVTSNSSIAAATVSAAFIADHRLQVTIGATTYYLAASTTAW